MRDRRWKWIWWHRRRLWRLWGAYLTYSIGLLDQAGQAIVEATTPKGQGFPFPYIDGATFRTSDMKDIGRPLLWSSSYAWMYGFASPNSQGDIGIAAFFGGGKLVPFPSVAIGIRNEDNFSAPAWKIVPLVMGKHSDKWGDYIRVRG